MSLLDSGPHLVTVTPMVATEDRYGAVTLSPGDPMQVRGALQPASVDEDDGLDPEAPSQWLFICRGPWPGGPHSLVTVDEHPYLAGREFDQHGEARTYGMSPRTQHVDIALTARAVEVK